MLILDRKPNLGLRHRRCARSFARDVTPLHLAQLGDHTYDVAEAALDFYFDASIPFISHPPGHSEARRHPRSRRSEANSLHTSEKNVLHSPDIPFHAQTVAFAYL